MSRLPRFKIGFVAQGRMAVGVVAVGGVAIGVVAVGAVSIGLVAIGGIAVGGLALGAIALGFKPVGAISFGLLGAIPVWVLFSLGGPACTLTGRPGNEGRPTRPTIDGPGRSVF